MPIHQGNSTESRAETKTRQKNSEIPRARWQNRHVIYKGLTFTSIIIEWLTGDLNILIYVKINITVVYKSFLRLLLRAGDVNLGGHVLRGWRPSKVISLHWIWSCMKPENWLRIDLSGGWCLCIVLVLHATIGLDWIVYWIVCQLSVTA